MNPSARTGADPRTPSRKIRRFGTVLSVNSPAPTPPQSSSKKKARVRHSAKKAPQQRHTPIQEEEATTEEYTVNFDAGVIGLQLNQREDAVLVKRFVDNGAVSPAQAAGTIQVGDAVLSVNGLSILEFYDQAVTILQNAKIRRAITFRRSVPKLQEAAGAVLTPLSRGGRFTFSSTSSPPPTSIQFKMNAAMPIEEDESSRSKIDDEASTLAPQILSKNQQEHSVLEMAEEKPTLTEQHDELTLTRLELDGAKHSLQLLQERLEVVEAENEALRVPTNAIKDMEVKLRIGILENELKSVKESKTKLKERVRSLDKQLIEQSQNDRAILDKTKQELSDVVATLRETMENLESTRKQLEATKMKWRNESDSLQQENSRLTEMLDKHSSNLERSMAKHQQLETRIRQLEEARSLLENELKLARHQLTESSADHTQNREKLLVAIRTKDSEIEQLRMDLVSTQSDIATLRSDVAEKDSTIRKTTDHLEQLRSENNTLCSENDRLSGLLEEASSTKHAMAVQLTSIEDKLQERDEKISSITQAAQMEQQELLGRLADEKELVVESAEKIFELEREKDALSRQVDELRSADKSASDKESRLRSSLKTVTLELDDLKNSSMNDKCGYLKRIEQLEGEIIKYQESVEAKEGEVADSRSKLEIATSEINRLSAELSETDGRLTEAVETIEQKTVLLDELNSTAAAKQLELEKRLAFKTDELCQLAGTNKVILAEKQSLLSQVQNLYKAVMSASLVELVRNAELQRVRYDLDVTTRTATKEKNELRKRVEGLEANLEESERNIDNRNDELASVLFKLEKTNEDVEMLSSRLAEVKSDLEVATSTIISSQQQFESLRSTSEAEKQELRRELEDKSGELVDLSSAIATLESEKQGLLLQMQDLDSARQAASTQQSRLQCELERAISDLTDTRTSNETARSELLNRIEQLDLGLKASERTNSELSAACTSAAAKEAQLQQRIITIEDELAVLLEKLSTSTAVNDDLTSELNENHLELDRALRELEARTSEIEQLKASSTADVESFEAEKRALLSQIQELRSSKATLSEEQKKLQAELGKAKSDLKDVRVSAETTKNELLARVQTLEPEVKQAQEQSNSAKEEVSIAIDKLDAANTVIDRLSADLLQAETDVRDANSIIDEKEQLLGSQRANAKETIDRLNSEKNSLTTELQEVRLAIQVTNEAKTGLLTNVERLESELVIARAYATTREKELLDELENAESKLQTSQLLVETKENDLETLRTRLSTVASKNKSLATDLQKAESTIISLTDLVENGNVQVEELQKSTESMRSKFESEIAETKDEVAQSTLLVDGLQSEKDRLTEQITTLQTTVARTEDEKTMLKNDIERFKSDLMAVHSSKSAAESELQHRIELLELDLQDRQSTVEKQNSDLTSLRDELSSMSTENESLSNERVKLESKLDDATSQITKLRSKLEEHGRREKKLIAETEAKMGAKLNDAVAAAETKLMEANNNVFDLKAELQLLELSKAASTDEIVSLKGTVKDLSQRLVELKSAFDEKKNQLAQKELECTNFSSSLESKQNDLEDKAEIIDATERALQDAHDQIFELKTHVSKLLNESSKAEESAASRIISLNEQIAGLTSRNTELEENTRSLESRISESEAQLNRSSEQLSLEKEASQELKESSSKAQTSLNAMVDKLTAESAKYRELSNDLNNECGMLKAQVESLQDEIEKQTKEQSSVMAIFESKQDENIRAQEDLKEQVAAEKRTAADLANNLRVVRLEKDRIARDSAQLQRRLDEQARLHKYDADLKAKRQAEWSKEREVDLQELRLCREKLRVANINISRLEGALKRSREETMHFSSVADQQVEEHGKKIEMLSESHASEMESQVAEKNRLERLLRKVKDEKESLGALLDQAKEDVLAVRSQRDRTKAEKDLLFSELHEAKDLLSELQCEVENRQNASLDDSDSLGSFFKGLSNYELKLKCIELEKELQDADDRTAAAKNDIIRRSEHVKRLSEDLTAMADEIDSLVETNELLERRLQELSSLKESSDLAASSRQSEIHVLQKQALSLKGDLSELSEQKFSLSTELQNVKQQLNDKNQELTSQKRELEHATYLQQELAKVEQERDEAAQCFDDERQKWSSLLEQNHVSTERIVHLESSVSELQTKLFEATKDRDEIQVEFQSKINHYEENIFTLETTCASLLTNVTELNLEIETTQAALRDKDERERTLNSELEKQQEETLVAERTREEVVSKLTEASRVVALQKESIDTLESRAAEAERRFSSLSDQVKQLQTANEKSESSLSSIVADHRRQIHDLETKCSVLEDERSAIHSEANKLRDDLREVRHLHSESKNMNVTLETRMETLKNALESSKAQLREARTAKADRNNSTQNLEYELDSKQVEIDHLKASVQVLTATSARLKADNLLIREAAHQAEASGAASNADSEEFTRMSLELQAKSSKLATLSDVYRSQQQVLALSQTLEGQLMRFIEEILSQSGSIYRKIALQSERLQDFGNLTTLDADFEALDLAGFENRKNSLVELRMGLDNLSLLVPQVLSQLEEKRAQLKAWKERRTERVAANHSTPDSKGKGIVPDSPAILDSFNRMKNVLNDEILSPNKIWTKEANSPDAEYMKKVIHSLEGQIDVLLLDLQAANDALRAKDQMFADLEELVKFHESERTALDKKMKERDALVAELEARLKKEVSWKEAAEKELAQIREGLPSSPSVTANHDDLSKACKLAAGRLLISAIDGRANAAKAVAFRQWACQTSALRAVSQQGNAAAALARQLEETREKLVILKRHLKKQRRGGSRDSGLDRINEH